MFHGEEYPHNLLRNTEKQFPTSFRGYRAAIGEHYFITSDEERKNIGIRLRLESTARRPDLPEKKSRVCPYHVVYGLMQRIGMLWSLFDMNT